MADINHIHNNNEDPFPTDLPDINALRIPETRPAKVTFIKKLSKWWIYALRVVGFFYSYKTPDKKPSSWNILFRFFFFVIHLSAVFGMLTVPVVGLRQHNFTKISDVMVKFYAFVPFINIVLLVIVMGFVSPSFSAMISWMDENVSRFLQHSDKLFVVILSVFWSLTCTTAIVYLIVTDITSDRVKVGYKFRRELFYKEFGRSLDEDVVDNLLLSMDIIINLGYFGTFLLRGFITIIVFTTAKCFSRLNQQLERCFNRAENGKDDVREVLSLHSSMCKTLDKFDKVISWLNLVYYFSDIVLILCMITRVTQLIQSAEGLGNSISFHVLIGTLIQLIVQTVVYLFVADEVHFFCSS